MGSVQDFERQVNPYAFTSGGFLHQDELQKEARHIDFNFRELCARSLTVCPGARNIKDIQKLEGGFNRCFVLEMDNKAKVVAKIPTKLAGPHSITTSSEVATMQLISEKTNIPIPRVLDWNNDAQNRIGTEYIIMEYIDGPKLGEVWDTMDALQRLQCTEKLSRLATELAEITFPGYGSLYHTSHKDASKALPCANSTWHVGPHCGSRYWKCGLGDIVLYGSDKGDCGPWKDLPAFAAGLYSTALTRVPPIQPSSTASWRGDREDILSLLGYCNKVMQSMVRDARVQAAATPVLYHPDFDMKNILVSKEDPTDILAIIDWQGASVEPAFLFASTSPDFASLPISTPYTTMDESKKADLEKEFERCSLCAQAYDAIIRLSSKRLQYARELPDAVARLFLLCLTPWTAGATAIRAELLRIHKAWSELGFEGQCPYVPTDTEIQGHEKLVEELETAQTVQSMVTQMLGTNADGFIPIDRLEAARRDLPTVVEWWIQACEQANEGVTREQARAMFPFDGK